MKISAYVRGQELTVPVTGRIAADTIDYLDAEFFFSHDWDGLIKTAHFSKGGTTYDIILTEDTILTSDHLNLTAGVWSLYVHGNEVSGDTVTRRVTTNIAEISVESTGILSGEPLPVTPVSAGEQLLARAANAETIARSVRDDADAGEFDGAPGSDAQVTAENIAAALGYTPEKQHGVYELIETITLTEDVTSIVRTQEPDGTEYNFEALEIKFNMEIAAGSAGLHIFIYNRNQMVNFLRGYMSALKTSKTWSYINFEKHYGFFKAFGTSAAASAVAEVPVASCINTYASELLIDDTITRLYMYTATAGVPIPAGSTIEIWGVRA